LAPVGNADLRAHALKRRPEDEGGIDMRKMFLGIMVGFGLVVVLFMLFASPPAGNLAPPGVSYPYSAFIADVDDGKVEEVTFQGPKIAGWFKNQGAFQTLAPHAQVLPALTDRLLAKKVTVRASPVEDDPSVASVLIAWIPFLLCYGLFFGGVWLLITRPMLALIRQLEASIKSTHQGTGEPTSQDKV
jgi:ATP-dependent Zn protease